MVKDDVLLEFERLGCDVGQRTLWNDLSGVIATGDSVAVRGPSGQGKSTLLRVLGGFQVPSRGRVRVLGADVYSASARTRRRLRRTTIGSVMQDHGVVPQWTTAQNLDVARDPGQSKRSWNERVRAALESVGLEHRLRSTVAALSGGEQQRVAVARVLAQRPRVVLADEPTASLDPESAEWVRAGLDRLRATGSAIVVATHDEVLAAWARRQLHLDPDCQPPEPHQCDVLL